MHLRKCKSEEQQQREELAKSRKVKNQNLQSVPNCFVILLLLLWPTLCPPVQERHNKAKEQRELAFVETQKVGPIDGSAVASVPLLCARFLLDKTSHLRA